jgi:hypothetical protein
MWIICFIISMTLGIISMTLGAATAAAFDCVRVTLPSSIVNMQRPRANPSYSWRGVNPFLHQRQTCPFDLLTMPAPTP